MAVLFLLIKVSLQYCNGAKIRMVDLEGERLTLDWWLHVPDFMLPKLEDVTINDEISVKNDLKGSVKYRFRNHASLTS